MSTLLQRLEIPIVTARVYDAGGRWCDTLHYSHGATPDHRRVDVSRLALEVLTLDEMRLGRRRARSGAEKVLRAAGFSDPGRQYAFALDVMRRHDRRCDPHDMVAVSR